MSVHINKTENLAQQNPESFSENLEFLSDSPWEIIDEFTPFCKVPKSIYQDRRLTHLDRSIYGIICGLSGASGRCFISDKKLNEDFYWLTPSRFSRITTKLHDLRLLYKRTRSHKGKKKMNEEVWWGSQRDCVPVEKANLYIKYLIKRGELKEAAMVKAHFEGLNEEKTYVRLQEEMKEKATTCQKSTSDHLSKKYKSIEVSKDTSLDKSKGEGDGPFSSHKIREEFQKRQFSQDKIEIAVEYAKMHQAQLGEKQNWIAYLVKMVGKGWAGKALELKKLEEGRRKNAAQKREEKQKWVEANKKLAQEIKKWKDDHPEGKIKIYLYDHYLDATGFAKTKLLRIPFDSGYAYNNLNQVLKALKNEVNDGN